MARATKAKHEDSLAEADARLAERIASNEAESSAARGELERLRSEQTQALRDGGRERAKALIEPILVTEKLVALLEAEHGVLTEEERGLRARRLAEEHVTFEHQVEERIRTLAAAAADIDKWLNDGRPRLASFAAALTGLFDLTAPVQAHLPVVEVLGRWSPMASLAERVGRMAFEVFGRGCYELPLGEPNQRFAEAVSNPAHIAEVIRRDLRRPEALTARLGNATLAEAVARHLEGGESS